VKSEEIVSKKNIGACI